MNTPAMLFTALLASWPLRLMAQPPPRVDWSACVETLELPTDAVMV